MINNHLTMMLMHHELTFITHCNWWFPTHPPPSGRPSCRTQRWACGKGAVKTGQGRCRELLPDSHLLYMYILIYTRCCYKGVMFIPDILVLCMVYTCWCISSRCFKYCLYLDMLVLSCICMRTDRYESMEDDGRCRYAYRLWTQLSFFCWKNPWFSGAADLLKQFCQLDQNGLDQINKHGPSFNHGYGNPPHIKTR